MDVIVLRKTPYQESSLIIATISAEHGRVDFLVKGAKKITGKKQPVIDIFRELAIEFRESSGTLHIPLSIDLVNEYDNVALHTEIFSELMHLTSFLLKHIHPHIPCKEVYSAFKNLLAKGASNNLDPFGFVLLKLVYLKENGLLPEHLSGSPGNEETQRQFLNQLLDYATGRIASIPKLTLEYKKKLTNWINRFEL